MRLSLKKCIPLIIWGLSSALGASSDAVAASASSCLVQELVSLKEPSSGFDNGWSETLRRWWGSPKFDLSRFERDKARFVALIREGREDRLPKRANRRETKAALVFAIMERGGQSWLELPINSKRAEKFMREISPKRGRLTALEAKKIVRRWFLLSKFGRRLDTEDIFLWDYLVPDLERLADAHLTYEALRVHRASDLIEFLRASGLVKSPSLLEHLRTKKEAMSIYVDIAKSSAMNAMSLYLTGLPIPRSPRDWALVLVRPDAQEMFDLFTGRKTPAEVVATSKNFRDKLRLEQGLHIAQRIYASYIFYGVIKSIVSNWEEFVAGVSAVPAWVYHLPGWARTAWSARDMSEERIKQEEAATYDSEAIILEQYEAWLEGLDEYAPTDEEKEAQLKLLREQERRGDFRIYKEGPEASPSP